jgi:hypothetical protein
MRGLSAQEASGFFRHCGGTNQHQPNYYDRRSSPIVSGAHVPHVVSTAEAGAASSVRYPVFIPSALIPYRAWTSGFPL